MLMQRLCSACVQRMHTAHACSACIAVHMQRAWYASLSRGAVHGGSARSRSGSRTAQPQKTASLAWGEGVWGQVQVQGGGERKG